MRRGVLVLLVWWIGTLAASAATITISPWEPLFQGIDHAVGRQQPVAYGERQHVVHALRIDLTDPDLRMFGLPPCTNCAAEVISTTVSDFLRDYGLQVAVNGNFFSPNSLKPGTPTDVLGLAISSGQIVSPANDAEHPAALVFTTNNRPIFLPRNLPSTNLAGIYTAVSGNRLLVLHGDNVANPTNDVDPRAAMGISQDERYLYSIIIDGRQSGYSDGATYYETAEWLIRLGAYHGMNIDGGSCATMAVQDCLGATVRLNSNSYAVGHGGEERGVGHMIGFYAPPARTFMENLHVQPGDTTATIIWQTPVPASHRVEFGLTTNYGSLATSAGPLLAHHVVTLTNLRPNALYHFRAVSESGNTQYTRACRFHTTNLAPPELIFDLMQPWTFTTNNLDGVHWTAVDYDDSRWIGTGPGILCVETNGSVAPRNTMLPPAYGGPIPPTYYFRTRFTFEGDPAGVALVFSNYIDDGAVFYLNGAELYRLRMRPAPSPVLYTNLATGYACSNAPAGCSGDACASCPDLFTIPSTALTNLYIGENVLAVEVHNYSRGSYDMVFGTALYCQRPQRPRLELRWICSEAAMILHWNRAGSRVQYTDCLSTNASWVGLPGAGSFSPLVLTNLTETRFYRLVE